MRRDRAHRVNEYKLKLSNDIGLVMGTPIYDLNWRSVGEIISKAAIETIPRLGRRIRNVWFDDECSKAAEEKNKAPYKNL
ncbi:hypothetical protein AVEN_145333-1 [Araneus ventricosus]|uniref:Uncharacterized protein n=1 Tax=Araneus ventricosus TaxID=182803 RepID=A0A4Y2GK73_ARAVE|nr:hypothetical protein AVEN_145333-1 [Araneus ventricosus]